MPKRRQTTAERLDDFRAARGVYAPKTRSAAIRLHNAAQRVEALELRLEELEELRAALATMSKPRKGEPLDAIAFRGGLGFAAAKLGSRSSRGASMGNERSSDGVCIACGRRVELCRHCVYCAGSGEAFDPQTGEGPVCPACDGKGLVERARALLRWLIWKAAIG